VFQIYQHTPSVLALRCRSLHDTLPSPALEAFDGLDGIVTPRVGPVKTLTTGTEIQRVLMRDILCIGQPCRFGLKLVWGVNLPSALFATKLQKGGNSGHFSFLSLTSALFCIGSTVLFHMMRPCTWGFPQASARDAARRPGCTTLQQLAIAAGTNGGHPIAVRYDRSTRVLSATVLYWQASSSADERARMKRDLSRQQNSRETGPLDDNFRLMCNSGQDISEVSSTWGTSGEVGSDDGGEI
jgi:hypothetical protein